MIAIIVGVFVRSNIYYLIISVVGALLFSAYLLFDLQLIMGGCAYWPCLRCIHHTFRPSAAEALVPIHM